MFHAHEASTRRSLILLGLAALVLLAPACGTLLYPERHGQDGGDLDPTVLILDGIGLLFWLVPGLLAFVVDFATGSIYERGIDLDAGAVPMVFEPREVSLYSLGWRPRAR